MPTLFKVPDDIADEFRHYVIDKKGKFFRKGDYMEELGRAITCYINRGNGHKQPHTHTFSEDNGSESESKANIVVSAAQSKRKLDASHEKALSLSHRVNYWLIESYGYDSLEQVTEERLKQAITAVDNVVHHCTIDNRIRLLVSNQCIEKNLYMTASRVVTYNLEPKQEQEQEQVILEQQQPQPGIKTQEQIDAEINSVLDGLSFVPDNEDLR